MEKTINFIYKYIIIYMIIRLIMIIAPHKTLFSLFTVEHYDILN